MDASTLERGVARDGFFEEPSMVGGGDRLAATSRLASSGKSSALELGEPRSKRCSTEICIELLRSRRMSRSWLRGTMSGNPRQRAEMDAYILFLLC